MSVITDLSGSQMTHLSGSHVDDTPTATSTAGSVEFKYVKESNDLTDYALDFMYDEVPYYPIIKSYTSEEKVALFICVNGVISVGGYYMDDGEIQEYFRGDDASEKIFDSIKDWYDDFYGEPVSIDKLLNNVFIGEDLVPLWKVLVDEKESDAVELEFIEPKKLDRVNEYCILLITYLTVVSFSVSIFGIILLSFV
jgi:hypothetical protein